MVILLKKRRVELPQDDIFDYVDWRRRSSVPPEWTIDDGTPDFSVNGVTGGSGGTVTLISDNFPSVPLTEASLAMTLQITSLAPVATTGSIFTLGTIAHAGPYDYVSVFHIPGWGWVACRRGKVFALEEALFTGPAASPRITVIGRWNGSTNVVLDVFLQDGTHVTTTESLESASGNMETASQITAFVDSTNTVLRETAIWTKYLSDEEVLVAAKALGTPAFAA